MRHEAALAHRSRSRHLDAEVLATASCRANFATYVSLCALLAFATIGQILRSRPNFQSQPACVTVQNVADGLAHHRPRRRNGAPASSSGSGLPPPQLRRNMPTADPSPRSLRRFATIKAKRSSDRRSGNRVNPWSGNARAYWTEPALCRILRALALHKAIPIVLFRN